MRDVHVIYKKQGETPLQALSQFVSRHKRYAGKSACYAGRLDPMARGKLILLFGDECKKKEMYTKYDKKYDIEVLLDVGSDTGDALGIVSYDRRVTVPTKRDVHTVLRAERGAHERAYPVFSSKTVEGKPLFLHALEDTLSSILIPTHIETIYNISCLKIVHIESRALRARLTDFLSRVPKTDEPSKMRGADFRITDVRKSWEHVFTTNDRQFTILTLSVSCASGTYMRTLSERIGAALGTKALALSINRTKIGKYWNGFWITSL